MNLLLLAIITATLVSATARAEMDDCNADDYEDDLKSLHPVKNR